MNRLIQTDNNRLNAAASRHAEANHQPESVSAETANDFRRLMGEGEGENNTDSAQQNAATSQPVEEFQHASASVTTAYESTPLDDRSSAQGAKQDVPQGTPQDVTQGAKQDVPQGTPQDVTQDDTQNGMEAALLQGDKALPSAKKDTPHVKQTAKGDVSDNAEATEANTAEAIDKNALAGMTNPFSRLFSDNMPKMQTMPTEGVSSSSSADLAEKFIERILVSQPDKNGQEIRLQLSQESGMNAEVRIVRGLDGSLSIAVHAKDTTSFQNLVAAQDRLKAALDSQERGTVRVQVLSQTDQENNDANRRSRGYMPPESED